MDREAQEAERVLANKRRQAYFRRRREVQRIDAKSQILALDKVATPALWAQLRRELYELADRLSEGSSPPLYGASRRAFELAEEIYVRGEQLRIPGV